MDSDSVTRALGVVLILILLLLSGFVVVQYLRHLDIAIG